MTSRYNGSAIRNAYHNGQQVKGIYWNGNPVYTIAGLPTVDAFSLSTNRRTIGTPQTSFFIRLQASGSVYAAGRVNRLEEILADGTRRTIAEATATRNEFNTQGNQVSFGYLTPMQNAQYVLTLSNANGSIVRTLQFYYGRIATISTWTATQFRQGTSVPRIDTILLTWDVTGAVPAADIDITTNRGGAGSSINFHPQKQQSGRYSYTRVGGTANTSEQLTLTAANVFGRVSQELTVAWGA